MAKEATKDFIMAFASAVAAGFGFKEMGLPGSAPLYFALAILFYSLGNALWGLDYVIIKREEPQDEEN